MANLEFITKPNRRPNSGGSTTPPVTPDTISAVVGSDVQVSTNATLILIVKSGYPLAQLTITEIINWEIGGSTLYIYSADSVPLALSFTNVTQLGIGLATLIAAINA
jgi:hypothetical protein